jgi:DNA-binding transcriptional LysR family regulator
MYLDQQALFKRIQRLEALLSVRLLNRTPQQATSPRPGAAAAARAAP